MKKVQRYFLDYEFSKNNKVPEIKNKNSIKIILNDKKNYEINKFFISKSEKTISGEIDLCGRTNSG